MADAAGNDGSEQSSTRLGGRFRLVRHIATGGCGVVFEARDRRLGRPVAIKRLPHQISEQLWRERFRREAYVMGRLDHPAIVPVHDFRRDRDGADELVMKMVEGKTLSEVIAEAQGSEDPVAALRSLLSILERVCEAIAFAHTRGVVHRDLKPENIMVGQHGQVYVMDWGLAKLLDRYERQGLDVPPPEEFEITIGAASLDDTLVLNEGPEDVVRTSVGAIMGSPRYMAPEQARGDNDAIDERTDVFGLGAVLYEMLTGEPPHPGDGYGSVLTQAVLSHIQPPRERIRTSGKPLLPVPPRLERVCLKALSFGPEHRYRSVTEFLEAIRQEIRHGSWFETRTVPAGAILVREGDESREAFLIRAGECQVVKADEFGNPRAIHTLHAGDVFGEAGLVTRQSRSASVVAVTDVVVECLSEDSLRHETKARGALALFTEALARRFLDRERELLDEIARLRAMRDDA